MVKHFMYSEKTNRERTLWKTICLFPSPISTIHLSSCHPLSIALHSYSPLSLHAFIHLYLSHFHFSLSFFCCCRRFIQSLSHPLILFLLTLLTHPILFLFKDPFFFVRPYIFFCLVVQSGECIALYKMFING